MHSNKLFLTFCTFIFTLISQYSNAGVLSPFTPMGYAELETVVETENDVFIIEKNYYLVKTDRGLDPKHIAHIYHKNDGRWSTVSGVMWEIYRDGGTIEIKMDFENKDLLFTFPATRKAERPYGRLGGNKEIPILKYGSRNTGFAEVFALIFPLYKPNEQKIMKETGRVIEVGNVGRLKEPTPLKKLLTRFLGEKPPVFVDNTVVSGTPDHVMNGLVKCESVLTD
jgi:hypothetical protein